MLTKNTSAIDRKTASKMLRVSVRTIDRYIRRGNISARQENGRIWLDKKEVLNFNSAKIITPAVYIDRTKGAHMSTQNIPTIDNDFYRDLYEEAKKALHDYQHKLEQATYRIGQLESQIMHPQATPKMIEPQQRHEDAYGSEFLKKEINDKDRELAILKDALRKEQSGKLVFTILTYILLVLLPMLWYLLR